MSEDGKSINGNIAEELPAETVLPLMADQMPLTPWWQYKQLSSATFSTCNSLISPRFVSGSKVKLWLMVLC